MKYRIPVLTAVLLCLLHAACIIPVPRTVEIESREKVLPYSAVKVLSAVEHVITREGFTIQEKDIAGGLLTARKSGKVAGDSMTVNTGKGTLFGMAMVFDTLNFTARADNLAPKKTRLALSIDCKKWYAKNVIDKAFQEVETKLFLEDGK
ncbi:MAG TPA: hypothetical protein PK253_11440 [Spirochaetota bacterium]|nr:hypothetical protein [Spirochaetota bacterium]HPQ53852.1 hypothetical protein [Spirochaetota bacterium]